MSQASQNVGGPARKRTRPSVNLNAACRRRKENKDSLSSGDNRGLESSDALIPEKNNVNVMKENVGSAANNDNLSDSVEKDVDVPCEKVSNIQKDSKNEVQVDHTTLNPAKNCSNKESLPVSESPNRTDSAKVKLDDLSPSDTVSDSSQSQTNSTNSEKPMSVKKCPPKGIHRFNRRNCQPNIVRGRPVNAETLKPTSVNKTGNSNECSNPPIATMNRGKENTECMDNAAKVASETCDSDDESRQSVSSVSTVALVNGSGVDCNSNLEDDRSSVCSFTSTQEKTMDAPRQKRNLSASSQRLFEAKRTFESRFGKNKPDKNSLRMFDLIYYNPSNSPMKSQEQAKEAIVSQIPSTESETAAAAEENVDNPDEVDVEEEEEEDVDIPAPRVKVGPDGEIVLDEQSLVIETTQSKKSRKEMANLTVVVDTGTSTTYGTYSKRKRSRREWSEKDTIKFYKALQAIGTDFSLMQTLFPTHSRVDLKAKFKKEEKINGHLIEKALRFPALFDLTELEKEQENSRNEEENATKQPKPRKRKSGLRGLGLDEEDCGTVTKGKKKTSRAGRSRQQRKPSGISPDRRKRRRSVILEIPEEEGNETSLGRKDTNTNDDQQSSEGQPGLVYDVLNQGFDDAFHEESRDGESNSEDNLEPVVPNGDGAIERDNPQADKNSSVPGDGIQSENTQNEGAEPEVVYEGPFPSVETFSVDNVQPGSIVLFTTECPDNPGYHICNVFMVQDHSNESEASCETSNNSVTAAEVTLEHPS